MPGIVLSIILLFIITQDISYSQKEYSLKTGREGIILTGGLMLGIADLLIINGKESISKDELKELSIDNINSFDKSAVYNFSPEAGAFSDVLLYSTILSPLLLTTSSEIQNNIGPFLTMYLENTLTALSISHLPKAVTGRFRPYTYNTSVPDEKRMDPDSRLSFFSGHATLSFASAVFLSATFSKYYPDSNYKVLVWGSSLLAASFVGYLRYAAGAHFPTDILTGALIGSLVGYLIPMIHEVEKETDNLPHMQKPANNIFSISLQL